MEKDYHSFPNTVLRLAWAMAWVSGLILWNPFKMQSPAMSFFAGGLVCSLVCAAWIGARRFLRHLRKQAVIEAEGESL